jgi:hypothetical protein
VPANAAAPWTSPTHGTPLERLASQVASQIVGRTVSVRCDSVARWRSLGHGAELGSVSGSYNPTTNRFVADSNVADLSPQACQALQAFAKAPVKPTRCRTSPQSPYLPCFLGTPVGHVSSVPGVCWQASGCFAVSARMPNTYWHTYQAAVQGLQTLAHEAIHLQHDRLGAPVPPARLVEAEAECSSLQWLAYVATRFGADAADARSIADYAVKVSYPNMAKLTDPYARSHPYWSAQCKPGGALDIRSPGSTVWP